MSEQVSTFMNVNIGDMKYLFIVVSLNDYSTRIKDELENQFNPFGDNLGPDAKVVRPFNSAVRQSFGEIRQKSWTDEMRERIDTEIDPFMLIIDKSFKEFDPEQDQWSIVWFSNFDENPEVMYKFFGALSNKIRNGENIFKYMNSVARNEKFNKYAKYFELKPGTHGMSVDIKALLLDLFGNQY